MKEFFKKYRFHFFVISFLLHMLFFIGVTLPPLDWFKTPKKEVVEISFTPAAPEPALTQAEPPKPEEVPKKIIPLEKQQVVDQDQKALNDEVDEKTRFLSAHNQVVQKQTIAIEKGDFKNAGESARKAGRGENEEASIVKSDASSPDTEKPKELDLKPEFDISKSIKNKLEAEHLAEEGLLEANLKRKKDKQEKAKKRSLAANSGGAGKAKEDQSGDAKAQASQSLDYIKDLDAGMETLLSTKEFVYYTYYNRIRRQLSQYWGSKVREKIQKMYSSGRRIASTDDKITRLLITLDKNGNLLKAQIVGDSGIHDLDEAAIEAFRSAAPFPNPPKGMVDPDGNIKIRWDFILEG